MVLWIVGGLVAIAFLIVIYPQILFVLLIPYLVASFFVKGLPPL